MNYTISFFLFFWRLVGWCFKIILPFLLQKRLKKNLEDKNHIKERYAIASIPRKSGKIIWIHAASVGETRAAYPLIEEFLKQEPTLIILMTTATLTGKRTIEQHPAYQKRIFHQFIPYDISPWNKNFLHYWQFSAAIFIENELWPGFLTLCKKKNIPTFLVNGRISDKSLKKWRFISNIFYHLLTHITLIIPRSAEDAHAFQKFGNFNFPYQGDLKEYSAALPYDVKEAQMLQEKFKNREIFVAASTHEGEEKIIIEIAKKAQKFFPNLLTIIIPRHPERARHLCKIIAAPLRSQGQYPLEEDQFWLIDTLGEVGLFYHLTKRVFLGNSLIPTGGGHNPYEALLFGCSLSTGSYLSHWRHIYKKHSDKITFFSEETLEEDFLSWLQSPPFSSPPLAPSTNLPHKIAKHILNIFISNHENL